MCSASSHAGRNSHLYNAISSYLHNVNRAQPIIGLNSIMEMWTFNQPAVYFCDVCFLRIVKTDIRNHIMGSLHRYNYISRHAHGWRSYTDLSLLARPLMDLATIVEKKEGTGDVQVLCVDEIIYKELTSWPVPAAFSKLNKIKNPQDPNQLQSIIHDTLVTGVQGLQEFENRDDITTESTAPTQHVSTSPVMSKCSVISEPRSQLSHPRQTPLHPRTSSPVTPLFQYQDTVHHVARPPGHWGPIPWQNEAGGTGFSHPFGVGYSVHTAQTAYAYEAQLQTSSFNVSHMVPEKTQNVTNRQEFFNYEGLIATPEPVSFIEPIITQRRAFESPFLFDLTQLYDEVESQEPVSTDFDAHVETQSHTSVEKKIPLPSRNSATQTRNLSDQIQSIEDSPETYNGKKPLIGLQAVIKCQSVDGNPPPCCYLCQLCSLKLKKKTILSHLTGCQHQRNYIKVLHPQLFSKIKHQRCNINEMLEDVAMQLEREDGRGQIKVMRLSSCLISEVLHRDYQWCMKVLNCGASLELFNKMTNKTTGHSQDLKRPAESIQSPLNEDRAPLSTHQMSKKMKNVHPANVTCTKSVKNPVFKVSLSLQEGPVVIERDPLRVTATVAPEIEDQSHNATYTDNNAMTLEINRQSEVQTCIHGCPLTVFNPAEIWNTPWFSDGNVFTEANIPSLTYTHTEVSRVDGRMFEDQAMSPMSPAPYAYEEQFDHSQAIQVVEPSLRREDCGSLENMVSVTYEDWPVQDFNDNDWILQRQIAGAGASDLHEYTRYMWD
ncbi:uncharacterized protein si:ch211-199g17.2 isoform X2 [Triplophysa rosa]|uniref:uncharacterized protein si:ch211-199g17.2 isoform X2 n=1 Tax=Triplophysa rosa TaxID=992332 RepID=UPI0025460D5B|nr:uncharacterized protein si:ch211-199g17.2 isoform X2 [Triplophysa rosa]